MEIEKSGDENYKRDGNTEEVMKKMKAEEGSAVEHKMRKKIKKDMEERTMKKRTDKRKVEEEIEEEDNDDGEMRKREMKKGCRRRGIKNMKRVTIIIIE